MNTKLMTGRVTRRKVQRLAALWTVPAVFIALCLPTLAVGEGEASNGSLLSQDMRALLQKPGDLQLRDATLAEALFSIRESWGINIVFGDDIKGQVNGTFKNTPLHEILDALLRVRGYGYRPVGQTLVIMKLDDVGQMKPLAQAVLIPLEVVSPSEVLDAVETLLSRNGKAHAINASKSLLVVDEPANVELIRQQVRLLDQRAAITQQAFAAAAAEDAANREANNAVQMDVAFYDLQYTQAEKIRPALDNLVSTNGKVAAIEKENRIVVTDVPSHLEKIDQAIAKLDVPRPQVRIRALIFDASLDDVERIGHNFNHTDTSTNQPRDSFLLNSVTLAASGAGGVNSALTLTKVYDQFRLSAVVHLLQTSKNSRLLADPSVTVVDQEEALMEIVREIPFQQLTEGLDGGSIGTTSFREAGVKLKVTPQVAADGTISMVVTPTFSVLAGFTEGDNQPIIDRREATTTVRVANGQTLVLGGMRQRDKVEEFTGIPYLKDIKLFGLGHLFRSRNLTYRDTELLVFITPEIITPISFGTPCEQQQYYRSLPQLRGVPADGDFSPLPPCGVPHHHHKIERLPPLHGDAGFHQFDGPVEVIEELPYQPIPQRAPTPAPHPNEQQHSDPDDPPDALDPPVPMPIELRSTAADRPRVRWVPPVSPQRPRSFSPPGQTPVTRTARQPASTTQRD